MRRMTFAASAGSLAMTATAAADLVANEVVGLGDIGAGDATFRLYLTFDNPLDQLLAINGDADVSPLIFDSQAGPLVQNNLFEGMTQFDDVPTVADLGGDSWVAITEEEGGLNGGDITHNTAFSPNFLGGNGMDSVIVGSHFEQLDNGGYYDRDPGTPALPDEYGRILIAQFTFDVRGRWHKAVGFGGTAVFYLGGGDLTSRAFAISFEIYPGPGALALFALAGLGTVRRRDP